MMTTFEKAKELVIAFEEHLVQSKNRTNTFYFTTYPIKYLIYRVLVLIQNIGFRLISKKKSHRYLVAVYLFLIDKKLEKKIINTRDLIIQNIENLNRMFKETYYLMVVAYRAYYGKTKNRKTR